MRDQIFATVIFWFLWVLGVAGQLTVIYDVFSTQRMGLSQQLFALTFFTLLPIGWGYLTERQDVCS